MNAIANVDSIFSYIKLKSCRLALERSRFVRNCKNCLADRDPAIHLKEEFENEPDQESNLLELSLERAPYVR